MSEKTASPAPIKFVLSDRDVTLLEDGADAVMEVRLHKQGYRFSIRVHRDATSEVTLINLPKWWNGQAAAVGLMQQRYARLVKSGRGTPYQILKSALTHAQGKSHP